MTTLRLYNSLTRMVEDFAPLDADKGVRVYSCGPTVYSDPHLGNLRAYVFTDTLARVLRWKGYPLTHVINITDVGHLTSDADAGDDKMEAAAKKRGQSAWDIAAHYTAVFKGNLSDLNIGDPSVWSVATDHIDEMIDFAARIAPAHCYEIDSGLYFDSSTVPDYGRLAGGQDDAGESRIDPVSGKRHPQDFAIWRKTPPGETRQMEWDSPWGRGAPGWHLECSVMSGKYLGFPFDIHTGGIDHREIHHPNEIAQNQAFCGCTAPEGVAAGFTGARFWMHNNFLVDRTGKLSKSKGSVATLEALKAAGVHPLSYRLMCLSAHYRSELEFGAEQVLAAQTRLKRLVMAVHRLRIAQATNTDEFEPLDNYVQGGAEFGTLLESFEKAICDDLNTPRALALLELLVSKQDYPTGRLATLAKYDEALGLRLTTLSREALRVRPADAALTAADIDSRLAERREARAAKDFARSDAIRDELTAAGVEVMDGDPLGWDWRPTL
ncbi:cysteine--tRNA ligase [Sphingomonas sp. BGYR3]|uniref:cysteine--tRNA ligase n=1 Tax=Sphingomonas sp. BGYR3 TaxID=2975483 RepID=UPI0021A32AF2|nr:cysteine--tRNA ligase [Sphingomonas sp. BGYR3]MDG5489860.1 cysteine--tRNA ligase [Sphingomonas sp. BGYR3]